MTGGTAEPNPDTLPTAGDPTGKCLRCGRISNFRIASTYPMRILGQPPQGRVVEQVTVLECMGCQDHSLVVEIEPQNRHGLHPVMWWPAENIGDLEQVAGVPADIVEAYSEGVRCIAVQAPHAAVAMFRTAIAEIVEDKGSAAAKAEKDLFKRIEQMVTDKTLWDTFGDWAHHIRSTGNAGAHPEKFDPVTMDQASELQRFVRELLNFLYEQRARLAAAKPPSKKTSQPAAGSQPPAGRSEEHTS